MYDIKCLLETRYLCEGTDGCLTMYDIKCLRETRYLCASHNDAYVGVPLISQTENFIMISYELTKAN
jgi:hypothetical protein